MDFNFKVPSTIPQDLLLIQDLIGELPPPMVAVKHVPDSLDSSDDSISSTDGEAESEDEVEADLAPSDDDSRVSQASSDSVSSPDSELDASSSSDSEGEREYEAHQQQIHAHDVEDEESGTTATATYLQTKNEVVDPNIMIPTISEVEPCDTLEKVGEIISIVGNVVIVRGLPVDHVNPLSGRPRPLDAESLLVFEDRKVLGYIYETFGPTSQPLYQVKFNQHYPLDTNKVWMTREVFHVPQRSHFVFVDQLKKLRGSDASNIHDEEPADDEIEFSDDEKEAAFRAQRRKRRGHSISSSRQSTPAPSRTHTNDTVQDSYRGSNPYDAHGPYDDDYHVTGPLRPSPVPYDDPYADVPTSDTHAQSMEMNAECRAAPSSRDGPKAPRGHMFGRGARGRGARNYHLWSPSRRGYRHNPVASQRTFDSGSDQSFPATLRTDECAIWRGQIGDVIAPQPLVQPAPNNWFSPETNIQDYQQPFIQPHINPRFASVFGFNLPGSTASWASQNAHDHTFPPQNWVGTWTMHGSAGSEGEEDTYRPV